MAVNTTLQNIGTLAGAEVAQLYVSFPAEAAQPVRILRGLEFGYLRLIYIGYFT